MGLERLEADPLHHISLFTSFTGPGNRMPSQVQVEAHNMSQNLLRCVRFAFCQFTIKPPTSPSTHLETILLCNPCRHK